MPSLWETLTGRKSQPAPTQADERTYDETTTLPAVQTFTPEQAPEVSSFIAAPNFDPAVLHPLAGLEKGLDYISLSEEGEAPVGQRGWSDDLCYGTGTTYLCALTIGGAWGLAEGLRKPIPVDSPKLKLNTVLNSITRRGPFMGNSAGVIALVYNGINSTIGYYRGKHDAANSILSGALAGALFKSTRGPKPMLIASGMTATAAGMWTVAKNVYMNQ